MIWKKSTCSYCGFGCGLDIGVEQGKVVRIRGLKGHPSNDGDLCLLPQNYLPLFTNKDRLKYPLMKHNNQFERVSWEKAIKCVANKFLEIIKEYGPEAIAFYGGAINFTEEYYLMNKLMKGAIGSNNVECSTRLCMASTARGFISTLGADAPPTCYEDIEIADLFLIAGCNMFVSVPVLFRRILRAKKRNNAQIIVVDPRITETAIKADFHLQIKPGTDVALNNALAYVLCKEGFIDENEVGKYTSGLLELKKHLDNFIPSKVSEITGCSEEKIIKAARMIGQSDSMLTFWFQGYNHSSQAFFKNNSLHNLSLLTGNFCKPGAGPLSITGEANALGNRWVGALSHLLPGMRFISNLKHRQEIAEFWGVPLENIKSTPGHSILDVINKLKSGNIHGLWIMATNPAASLPNTSWVRENLAKADLLVVQDIFHPTETTQLADVILPAAQWCEKEGTFISSERRIQLVEKIIDPPGEAKPDYEIIMSVARAMGFTKLFSFNSPEEVFEEWKQITRNRICDMMGVTYDRLRSNFGLQLPCSDNNHTGTKRLFTDWRFPRPDGRAALLSREYIAPVELTDSNYPFILITGRISYQFNTRTRTGRCPNLNNRAPSAFLNIRPDNAAELRISEGDLVKISSRRGEIALPARLTDQILLGTIFIPFHYGNTLGIGDGRSVNILTNNVFDIHSKQPEYKFCSVNIEKINTLD